MTNQPEDAGARAGSQEVLPGGIRKDLFDILICPACRGKVELRADGSALKCVACKRVYAIRNGIPVMLVPEATIEE